MSLTKINWKSFLQTILLNGLQINCSIILRVLPFKVQWQHVDSFWNTFTKKETFLKVFMIFPQNSIYKGLKLLGSRIIYPLIITLLFYFFTYLCRCHEQLYLIANPSSYCLNHLSRWKSIFTAMGGGWNVSIHVWFLHECESIQLK